MLNKLYKIYSLINNKYKTSLFIITILSILIAIFDTGVVIILSFIFDYLIDYKFDLYPALNDYKNSFILIAFMAVIFTHFVLNIFNNWFQVYYIQLLGTELSTRILKNFFKLSFIESTKYSLSKLTKEVIQDIQRIVTGIVYPIILVISKFFLFLFIGLILAKYDISVFIIINIIFVTIYVLIFQFLKKNLYAHGSVVTKINKIRFSIINDIKNGFINLKINKNYEKLINNFYSKSKKMANSTALGQVMTQTPRFFLDLLIFLCLILLMLFVFNSKNSNFEIVNILVIYASAIYRLLPAFNTIYSSLSTVQNNLASFDEINFNVLKDLDNTNIKEQKIPKIRELRLENIQFGYDKSKTLFSDLNIALKQNDILGISGEVGSGKSTFIKIFLGLIKPNKGKIFVNSNEVDIFENDHWFEKLSYVDQKNLIFDTNIIDNITLDFLKNKNLISTNQQKINDLTNKFDLKNLFKGYDLNKDYHDLEAMLSGGQKQIISILRGIYEDKEIIFLDEPTNNLDIYYKKIINSILLSLKDKIVIIVSHDKMLLEICNHNKVI